MSNSKSPLIRINEVSKRFRYWNNSPKSFKQILINLIKGKFNLGNKATLTVLDGVSFDIYPGEFVGIMGRNGAGKSTLLKLISGIYMPTAGKIEVNAPVAPLIELGAGFHYELSGYENIFLNAAILGFGQKATQAALPEILAFAELGDKIYMPVKNYSSGMVIRLGFAIATHLTAPILLIDEVLAVGDVGFQNKCLKKIHDLHKSGRTIILITHVPEAVRNHCSRCIVIDNHVKVYDGPAAQGVDIYMSAVGA